METTTKKSRLLSMRQQAQELRDFFDCRSGYQFFELERVIKEGERRHRRFAGGAGRPRGQSVAVAVDYFVIRTLDYAFDWHGTGSEKSKIRKISGVRTDYLIAISLVGQFRSELEEAGFTRAKLARAAELVDYCSDIASR